MAKIKPMYPITILWGETVLEWIPARRLELIDTCGCRFRYKALPNGNFIKTGRETNAKCEKYFHSDLLEYQFLKYVQNQTTLSRRI